MKVGDPKGLGSSVSYQRHGLLCKLSKITTLAPKLKSSRIQISFDENEEKKVHALFLNASVVTFIFENTTTHLTSHFLKCLFHIANHI